MYDILHSYKMVLHCAGEHSDKCLDRLLINYKCHMFCVYTCIKGKYIKKKKIVFKSRKIVHACITILDCSAYHSIVQKQT